MDAQTSTGHQQASRPSLPVFPFRCRFDIPSWEDVMCQPRAETVRSEAVARRALWLFFMRGMRRGFYCVAHKRRYLGRDWSVMFSMRLETVVFKSRLDGRCDVRFGSSMVRGTYAVVADMGKTGSICYMGGEIWSSWLSELAAPPQGRYRQSCLPWWQLSRQQRLGSQMPRGGNRDVSVAWS